MHIDPTGLSPSVPTPPPVSVSRPNRASEPAVPTDAEAFVPTDELARLLTAVSQTPEVRAEVIANVAARLAAGELATPEAAADTARALLQPE